MLPLLAALLAAPAPAAPTKSTPAEMIILTGGSTQADAEARLKNLKPVIDAAVMVAFSDGYPRIEKSDDTEGLKPGFFIVVAGVCESGSVKPGLDALKLLVPGTYAKPITWKEDAMPCASMGESPGAGRGWSHEGTVTKGKLRVHAFQYEYLEDGGEFERKEWAAVAILAGAAKDAVTEAHVIGSEGEFATFGSITEKGTSIVLIDEHADGTCMSAGTIGVFEERITVSASKVTILVDRTSTKLKDHECPEIESYGDAPPDMREE